MKSTSVLQRHRWVCKRFVLYTVADSFRVFVCCVCVDWFATACCKSIWCLMVTLVTPDSLFQALKDIKSSCTHSDSNLQIISRLLAPETSGSGQQSRLKCMVGKYKLGDDSEVKCRAIAERVAQVALSQQFRARTESLKSCLHPQLFACCCRLMVDDLMKCLPTPEREEDMYGADDLASFHALLWEFVIVPLLMIDESNCTRLFVKLLTVQTYGNIGEIDATERRIVNLLESSVDHTGSELAANRFFVKGQGNGGSSPDDHFLMVSGTRHTCCRLYSAVSCM